MELLTIVPALGMGWLLVKLATAALAGLVSKIRGMLADVGQGDPHDR